jgi:hypothetical protein
MKRKFVLKTDSVKYSAIDFIRNLPTEPAWEIVAREHKTTRSIEQNAKLWAMLSDVSRQVDWYGRKLSKEDWKCVFTSALKKVDVVPNLEGSGFVAIGLYTHKMSVKEMGDLIELISAFGAEREVKWTETRYEEAA